MARRLRIQYSDAIYHVMARGNGRQDIVQDDADRGRLVARGIGARGIGVRASGSGASGSGHRGPGIGPGRPGWLPTQVPHRSGLAHHAHPVPHLMNSRPVRSVVGTWTWFRSRCTCQVSLQRLTRRHPLPLTGSLGLVPPLQRYYEVLRLPAAHFAALRFLRLAIPSLRPCFVPPGPGRGAVDQSGVGRRYLQPPCSMETTGSPKFPEEPLGGHRGRGASGSGGIGVRPI